MSTITISLPDEVRQFVERQTVAGRYASAGDFLLELVREEQKRVEKVKLENLLLEGMESGDGTEVTEQYLGSLSERMQARVDAGRNQLGPAT